MKSDGVKLLIDCGGSGVKIKKYSAGVIDDNFQSSRPTTLDEFYSWIESVAKGGEQSVCPPMTGIAVSICGEYDYVNEEVLSCWHYPFLTGKLKEKLSGRFACNNVRIVNDGDAHALAFKAACNRMGLKSNCAINLSLGTAVGFGIIDCEGDLLHTCQGHNWEVGHWQCDTSEKRKEQYWVLGSAGLKSLEERNGGNDAYTIYGQRLCHFFARDLVPIFHPKSICLSGGIVANHLHEIQIGIQRECEERRASDEGNPLHGIHVYLSPEHESVMTGLADLLDMAQADGNTNGSHSNAAERRGEKLLQEINMESVCQKALRDCVDWRNEIPKDKSACALLAVNAGLVVCAEDGGNGAIIANRQACIGAWESFLLIRNDDGSISFRSAANDKFVSARPLPDAPLIAEGPKIDLWEKFELKKVSGKTGVFSLRSLSTQKYVSVDEVRGNQLFANRDDVKAWEEFRIFCR